MNLYVLPSGASKQNTLPFDAIRRRRSDGRDYWSARELQPMAGYSKWQDFQSAIERAMTSAKNQDHNPENHFMEAHKEVQIGSGAEREVNDYHLTRFGCYLVFQNGDPRKPEIALAQGYFAVKTREAETGTTAPADADTLTRLTGKVQFLRDISDLLGPEATQRYAVALAASVLGIPAETSPAVSVVSPPLANALPPVFWAELRARFVWDLLPSTFLADLYWAWSRRHHPASALSSHKQFVHDVLVTIAADPDWHSPGKSRQIRASSRMTDREPLVDEYSLTSWRTPTHKAVYRGVLRQL